MRSFVLFIAISLIALVFRILFASSDLGLTPTWNALAGHSLPQKPPAGETDGLPENEGGNNQPGNLAKEWYTLGFPVSHPLRPSSELIISGWYSPGLPWVQKSCEQIFGENWGTRVLKALFLIFNSLQPGLVFLVAGGLGWGLMNSFWVGLLAASSPLLIASFTNQTSAGLGSFVLLASFYISILAINNQSSWQLLTAGILLGIAALVTWEACLPAIFLLAGCVFTFRKFPDGWVPATLMVIGFVGVQIPWHWKLSRHHQDIPLGTVEPYAAFYLGTGEVEKKDGQLTERILSLSDPDSISYLASEDTSELNRARWFSTRAIQNIIANPGKWISLRVQATGHAFVGTPGFWLKKPNPSNEKAESEKDSTTKTWLQDLFLPGWLFGLFTAALASLALGPDIHPARRVAIAGLAGILASAFLFWDAWGFSFRILAEPFLALSCGFLFSPRGSAVPAGPVSS